MGSVPFSAEQFFGVFAAYNLAVWPAPLILSALAVVAILLAVLGGARRGRWVAGFLAALWAWTGIAYHLIHFRSINPGATLFGALFLVEAALFVWAGVVRGRLEFGLRRDPYGAAAIVVLLYALVVYPLLGRLTGHVYPATPTFGAPCPAVIFTFGILLLARSRVPGWLLMIPAAWGLLGTSAVFAFGVLQDAGLVVAALVGSAMILRRNRSPGRPTAPPPPASAVAASLAFLIVAGLAGCADAASAGPREPWVDRPVFEWPDFALTNRIEFTDTTYDDIANAFLLDTGADTVGVTCKHMFLVFAKQRGLTSIDPGGALVEWAFPSSRDTGRVVPARRLINADPREPIGDFESLKDRDWLIFELADGSGGAYPLKVRWGPLETGEVVYAVGRSLAARHEPDPTPSPLRVFRSTPNYHYVQPLDPDVDPVHTSGSPVIDGNGYLVGLVSGAVGRLGVVAGTGYLRQLLDRHGIPYTEARRGT